MCVCVCVCVEGGGGEETAILLSVNFAQRVVKVNDLTKITRLQKCQI